MMYWLLIFLRLTLQEQGSKSKSECKATVLLQLSVSTNFLPNRTAGYCCFPAGGVTSGHHPQHLFVSCLL